MKFLRCCSFALNSARCIVIMDYFVLGCYTRHDRLMVPDHAPVAGRTAGEYCRLNARMRPFPATAVRLLDRPAFGSAAFD